MWWPDMASDSRNACLDWVAADEEQPDLMHEDAELQAASELAVRLLASTAGEVRAARSLLRGL